VKFCRDENMTVSAVKKYLAHKLGLTNENEVGLACNSHLVSVSQAYPCIVSFVLFDLLYFQDLSNLRALLPFLRPQRYSDQNMQFC
jgi:hypothetical protein